MRIPTAASLVRRLPAFVAAALAIAVAATSSHAAEGYKLGVSDKLSVRVVQWQATDATFTDWTALTGSYVVGPDGSIAFPFVGEVPAGGKTTAELSKALSSGLEQALGLTDPPNVTIEVAGFGPVYIVGDVQAPGAYPFAPDLNVIKAISLAGGQRRGATETSGSDSTLISLQGAYDVLRDQQTRLMIHRARLDAEIAKANTITAPTGIENASFVASVMAAETAELQAGDTQFAAQLDALAAQKTLLSKGIETLDQKRATTQEQLDLARTQLDKVKGLVDSGLAVSTRVSQLQSNVANYETSLLDIDTAKLRAQQDLNTADVQIGKLQSDQFVQASQERQQVDSQLAETALKMATQMQLIRDAVASAGVPAGESGALTYTYSILRGGKQIAATAIEPVLPGDVITATLNLAGPLTQ